MKTRDLYIMLNMVADKCNSANCQVACLYIVMVCYTQVTRDSGVSRIIIIRGWYAVITDIMLSLCCHALWDCNMLKAVHDGMYHMSHIQPPGLITHNSVDGYTRYNEMLILASTIRSDKSPRRALAHLASRSSNVVALQLNNMVVRDFLLKWNNIQSNRINISDRV